MNFIQTESKTMLSYATQDQVEENWGLEALSLPTPYKNSLLSLTQLAILLSIWPCGRSH